MTKLWALVQAYLDSQGGMSARALARKIDVSAQTLDTWKAGRPDPANLRKLAAGIDVAYEAVLAAADADAGYLTEAEFMASLQGRPHISDKIAELLRRHVAQPPDDESHDLRSESNGRG